MNWFFFLHIHKRILHMDAVRFILMFEIWIPVAAYSFDETFFKQVDIESKYVTCLKVIQIVQNDKRRPTWAWTCWALTPYVEYSRCEIPLVAAWPWQRKKKETILCVSSKSESFWNCAELQGFEYTIQQTRKMCSTFFCVSFSLHFRLYRV